MKVAKIQKKFSQSLDGTNFVKGEEYKRAPVQITLSELTQEEADSLLEEASLAKHNTKVADITFDNESLTGTEITLSFEIKDHARKFLHWAEYNTKLENSNQALRMLNQVKTPHGRAA